MTSRNQIGVRLKSRQANRGRRDSGEGGYAYLLAMMLVMALMIASLAALEGGLAKAKRKQEAIAIWRGEQYVRAIRSFYKKTNRYPHDLEELQKGVAGVHFLRPSAYKNPMNLADGSWRLVYVNPSGQLIGSTRYANLQQMALIVLNNGQLPAPGTIGIPGLVSPTLYNAMQGNGTPNNNNNGQQNGTNPPQNGSTNGAGSNGDNQNGGDANGENGNQNQGAGTEEGEVPVDTSGNQAPPQTNQTNPGSPGTAPQLGNPGANQTGQGLFGGEQAVNPLLTMKPTGPVSGPVVGAFITGVALAQDVKSQKVYQGGKKYIEWEFIWNPMIDQARALASGQSQGATGALGTNGLNGNGANGVNGQNGNNSFGFGGILGGQQPNQQPGQQPNGQQPQQQDPNQPQQ